MKLLASILILTLLLALPHPAKINAVVPGRSCKAILTKQDVRAIKNQLDKIFIENFNKDGLYQHQFCHENVVKLYNTFKEKIPELKASDFNVIFIAPKSWVNTKTYSLEHEIKVKNPRVQRDNELFNFHAVLEYKGRIYDLDYTQNPRPINKKKYIKSYFYSTKEMKGNQSKHDFKTEKPIEELLAILVPGQDYLNYSFILKRRQSFYEKMIKKHGSFPLTDYFSE